MKRVLLCGGGTGGHIAPALAIARELEQQGIEVGFVTLGRSIEDRFVSGAAQRFVLPVERAGERRCRRLRLLMRLPRTLATTEDILNRFQPSAVVGTGGLASFFPLRAAIKRSLPTALIEVNAHAGKVTQRLARRVDVVLCGFEACARTLAAAGARTRVIGVPIRAGFGTWSRAAARAELRLPAGGRVIAVLGGSQGAAGINRIIAELAPAWVAAGHHLLHAAGPSEAARYGAEARALSGPGSWQVVEFYTEVEQVLAAADLVIARAGASTVAEIAAAGRAAVFVPYPHHADQHQLANAMALCEGASILQEHEWGAEQRQRLMALLEDAAVCQQMAASNLRAARADAAALAAREIVALLDHAPAQLK